MGVLQQKPDSASRVVLVEFPASGPARRGLRHAHLPDAKTGEELAAVYVPSAPNPTTGLSGDRARVEHLPPTDMTAWIRR